MMSPQSDMCIVIPESITGCSLTEIPLTNEEIAEATKQLAQYIIKERESADINL
jgi:hypothetical protein